MSDFSQRLNRAVARSAAARAISVQRIALSILAFIALQVILLPALALAQVTDPVAGVSLYAVLAALIPILTPIIIAALKKLLYVELILSDGTVELEPPTWLPKWSLPILAPLLGMLADMLIAYATGTASNQLLGLALGAIGVWVREVSKPLTNRKTATA